MVRSQFKLFFLDCFKSFIEPLGFNVATTSPQLLFQIREVTVSLKLNPRSVPPSNDPIRFKLQTCNTQIKRTLPLTTHHRLVALYSSLLDRLVRYF